MADKPSAVPGGVVRFPILVIMIKKKETNRQKDEAQSRRDRIAVGDEILYDFLSYDMPRQISA